MSKYQLDTSPIYIDGTDIPQNKLDITDSALIHEIESNLLTQAYEQFSSQLNLYNMPILLNWKIYY